MAKESVGPVEWNGDTVRQQDITPARYVMMYPTGAIVKGDWVAVDTGTITRGYAKHVKQAAANDGWVAGVACEAAAGASTQTPIKVQVQGVYMPDEVTATVANIATAVTIGQPLKPSATAGRADTYAVATPVNYIIGRALANAASNTALCYIYPSGL